MKGLEITVLCLKFSFFYFVILIVVRITPASLIRVLGGVCSLIAFATERITIVIVCITIALATVLAIVLVVVPAIG